MRKHKESFVPLLVGAVLLAGAAVIHLRVLRPQNAPASVSSPFIYSFNAPGVLEESGNMDESTSSYWWLNAGGRLIVRDGAGFTLQGELPADDPWRISYAATRAADTDEGYHPQNLFRLVTRSAWDELSERAEFLILRDNLSTSPNRNESNGLFLLSRYKDRGETLYYAGIRVDGTAVIKKKFEGVYYTMAQRAIFPEQSGSANLIPHGAWLGLRSDTRSDDRGTTVVLYMRNPGAAWRELVFARDEGQYGGTPPIYGPGLGGIRTDFMDVAFRVFEIRAL